MMRPFLLDLRGNVAILLGLALPVLFMALGSAVDYSRWTSVNAAVQAQVDSAALSAIASLRDPEALARIERGLAARAEVIAHQPTFTEISVRRTSADVDPESVVEVRAIGEMPTVVMRMFGFKTMNVGAVAEARRSPKTYEISLIVDVTGSMRGARINALRTASTNFVRALLPETTTSDRILVNIVPYTASVNIGRRRGDWLGPLSVPPHGTLGHPAGTGRFANKYVWRAPSAGENHDRVGADHCHGTGVTWDETRQICYIGTLSEWTRPGPCPGVLLEDGTCYVADGWGGCVEERGRGTDDVTDAELSTAVFKPYYWPSWGGVGDDIVVTRYNSYLPGAVDESRYTNANSNDGLGPNLGCPKDVITDWSNDRNYLLGQISSFEAWHRGGTMGHIGLAWGWRTMSPKWAGQWGDHPAPRPFDRTLVEKIAVFMTDGENGFYAGHAPPNDSDYTAYGRLSENPGVTRSNQQNHLDSKMLSVCNSMRQQGIEIFTVGFGLSNNRAGNQARALLRDCASSADHFFDATTTNLATYFENIATNIRMRGERLAR
jgi:Flp pilus assembly protein TadG